ncbi:hypothetical protein EBZ38_05090, partial [bacterium]|nr:hypothetical protein [bacterium]
MNKKILLVLVALLFLAFLSTVSTGATAFRFLQGTRKQTPVQDESPTTTIQVEASPQVPASPQVEASPQVQASPQVEASPQVQASPVQVVPSVQTSNCPPGAVRRGVECYERPPEGWDWTTPGGIIMGKVCPSGTTDTGVDCIYSRGVGKAATLTCKNGTIQRGVECYEAPPEGWNWTTPGGIVIGKVCPPGTTDTGVDCTYSRGVGKPMSTCGEGTIQRGADCYETPPEGWNWTTPGGIVIGKVCPPGTTDTGVDCSYSRSVGKAGTLTCPPSTIQRGAECYEAPPNGWNWTTPGGIVIGKVCPPGTTDTGVDCTYTREVGKAGTLTCPPGTIQRGLECYNPPPEGYQWTTPGGIIIGKVCPPGTTDTG